MLSRKPINELKFYFDLDLKIMAIMNPDTIATLMPAATAVIAPDKTPNIPNLSTPSKAPFTSPAPKPVIGTVIPDPANFLMGSNQPTTCRIAPITTNETKIRAGVQLVFKISNCPSKHTKPPITNAHKKFIVSL